MSTIYQNSTSIPTTHQGPLPGAARGALAVLVCYLALSVFGIFQMLAVRDDLSSRYQSVVDFSIVVTVAMLIGMTIGGILVAKGRSRGLLLVLAAINLGLAVFGLRNGVEPASILNIGLPATITILLRRESVTRYFAS